MAGFLIALTILTRADVLAQKPPPLDLTEASLDELMNMQVISVSKKEESLSKAPGSIYVITQDDIRHSGATNVPDLLRIVPGVDVARINANTWAISIRGFNNRYSSKVLVLIDGRTVFSPGFSGVFWDQQSLPLENIDRIEVIRGPGGTVWGANAMNGVINIITKAARDTHGSLISAEAGSQGVAEGLAQYGGAAGPNGSYRVFNRYAMNGDSPSMPGDPAVDDGHNSQAGFRADWDLSGHDQLTVQGGLSGASEGQTITTLFTSRLPLSYTFADQVRVAAGDILSQWNHVFSNGSEATLKVYYDRFRRVDQALNVVSTGDADFQYHFHFGARNDIVAGIGYRLTDQSYTDGYEIAFGTGHERDNFFSSFIQDQIRLTDTVALTMGTKFEHNVYTGFEYEPSVQLTWSPVMRQTVWASASKAIEQPSWLYEGAMLDAAATPLPGGGFATVQVNGSRRVTAPELFDYELGYRTEVSKRLTLDASVFLSDYDDLETLEPQTAYFTQNPAPPHLVLPEVYGNLGKATNYGMEISAHWDAAKWWRISPGFSFLQMNLSQRAGGDATAFVDAAGNSPKRQAQLRSNIKLPRNVEWDTSVYYVGSLGSGPQGTGPVPAYTRVDTRLGLHLGRWVDVGITGQNLLTPRHVEFLDGLQVTPMETARAVVAQVTWRH